MQGQANPEGPQRRGPTGAPPLGRRAPRGAADGGPQTPEEEEALPAFLRKKRSSSDSLCWYYQPEANTKETQAETLSAARTVSAAAFDSPVSLPMLQQTAALLPSGPPPPLRGGAALKPSAGPRCRWVWSFLLLLCCEGDALSLSASRPSSAHLGCSLLGLSSSYRQQQQQLQQQQQQQQQGARTPAFAAPLAAFKSLLRKRRDTQGSDLPHEETSSTDESDSSSSSNSSSSSTRSSSSGSSGKENALLQEAVESAVGCAAALAAQQLEGLWHQLHALLLQKMLQQQTLKQEGAPSAEAEGPPALLKSPQLPVTELSAAAVAAAAKRRLREVLQKAAAAAADEETLQQAEAKVEAFVDSEARGLFQQQMQQQILLLLQQVAAAAAAAPQGREEAAGSSPEQQVEIAAAAAVQQFLQLLQQSVPTAKVRERWGAQELLQLLQQQLQQLVRSTRMQRSQQQQQAETLLRVVQQQQGLLQQLQQQLQQEQQPRPFAFGAAYRVPDTNLQIAAAARQGRLQLNVTCAPDDSPAAAAAILGQQGFVRGVEALGNLGISCSFSV
ncbi:hypothetical protein Efla_000759 [Eimeria flavescens]